MKKPWKFLYNKWFYMPLLTFSVTSFVSLGWKLQQADQSQINPLLVKTPFQQAASLNWTDDSEQKIIDVFPQTLIANQVLQQLKINVSSSDTKFDQGINSLVSKTELGKIKILNFSNLGLTTIDELLNPHIIWTSLWQINLSYNNFSKNQLVFKKTNMPKLYKIIATNSQLNQMVDVSDYLLDPFDKTVEGTDDRTKAQEQYNKPLTASVPRYFDLANNTIREIPKYYLKINLGYLNLSNNHLGLGTDNDPMGINATPWYSLKTTTNTTGLLAIQDPSIRGPYGINVYNTGEKNSDNTYKYTDEQVARWRQSPFPIRGLTFGNFNDVPNTDNNLDTTVIFASGSTSASGGKKPFFNLTKNNLVAPMLFSQKNVDYDPQSVISPQEKSANVFVGLEDYKKSNYYLNQKKIETELKTSWSDNPNANVEILVPQPDSIYPFLNQNGFSTRKQLSWRPFSKPLFSLFTARSFNGFGLFEQTTDSRTTGMNNGYDSWDNNVETSGKIKNAGTETNTSGGIKWRVPKANDFKKTETSTDFVYNSVPNKISNGFIINDFITGKAISKNNKKWGFWGTNDETNTNIPGKTNPNLSFELNENDKTHYKRYKPFRTYLISAKSFAKTDRLSDYAPVFDGNVYYDTKNYENFNFNLQTFPSGNNFNNYDPNYGTLPLNTVPRPLDTATPKPSSAQKANYIAHFSSLYYNSENHVRSEIENLAPTNWISSIERDSSFGIKHNTPTPYFTYFNSTNGLYKYSSFYNVIDTIETELDKDSNFATSVENANGLNLSAYTNQFPQNVTATNIIAGKDKFWKSNKQFDQVYLNKLNHQDITTSYDAENGSLTYKFRIYSPGYSRTGRLFDANDTSSNFSQDQTKTIDLQINKTVTGFAKAKMQRENVSGTFEDFNTTNVSADNILNTQAPKSIKDLISQVTDYSKLTPEKIALSFKTSYLGNKAVAGTTTSAIEINQNQLNNVNSTWIKNIVVNGGNGTVQFNLEIPDYNFANGNVLAYPQKLKQATYVWTNLLKTQTTLIGQAPTGSSSGAAMFKAFNSTTFVGDLASKLNQFQKIQAKPANAITAKDIYELGTVVKTDVTTWKPTVTADNANEYITLFPNSVNGSLLFQIRFPADPTNFIPAQQFTVLWNNLAKQTTTVSWKSQETLKPLLQGKTPDVVLNEFKTDPSRFIDWTNPPPPLDETTDHIPKIQLTDLVFDANTNVIKNLQAGKIQFSSLKLKNFYQNGTLYRDGKKVTSPAARSADENLIYIDVLISPNYQAQPPVSQVTWKKDDQIVQAIKDYLKNNHLIQPNSNQYDLSDSEKIKSAIDDILNNMNAYDLKENIVNFNLNLANMKVFDLKNITIADFVFNPRTLNDNLEVENKTGKLIFKNFQFNNWQANNSFITSTHTLETHEITANPLVNTFKWSNNLTNALAILPASTIQNIFSSKEQGKKYIDGLNVGKKTFNSTTNALENEYTIDPSKIDVDIIAGKLTFKPNAITVSNFIKAKGESPISYKVTDQKEYILPNKATTNYFINTLVTAQSGYHNRYANFFYNQNYDESTPQQKILIDQELHAMHAPDLVLKSPLIATGLIRQSIIDNNQAQISALDLTKINELKAKATDPTVKATDFRNFFYLPKYLAFVSSLAPSGIERTYFIAAQITTPKSDATFIIVKNAFIINYLKNGNITILSLGDLIYPGFLWNGTTISFHQQSITNLPVPQNLASTEFFSNNQANLVPDYWKNSSPLQMQADLEFLTKNRTNPSINTTNRWIKIQQAWKQTFQATNVPFDGARDGTIAYPDAISVSSGEHTLKVGTLIFPYFINARFQDHSNASIANNQKINVAEIWYLKNGKDTSFNLNQPIAYEKFLNQIPSTALIQLNLVSGIQSEPQKTFNQFLAQNIYTLTNINPSILTANKNLPNYHQPTGTIGNIVIDNTSGILILKNIQIQNAYENGKTIASKLIPDINLQFMVVTSHLLANNPKNTIAWLKAKFGSNKSLAEMLADLEISVQNNTLNIATFNKDIQANNNLVYLDTLTTDSTTKAQINPNFSLKQSIKVNYVDGSITLSNLQIVNGYIKNEKQKTPIAVNPIKISFQSDFSINFTADFQPIVAQKQFVGLKPSEIQAAILATPTDLSQYITYNQAFQNVQTPQITIFHNDVLGTITFKVQFARYYKDGVLKQNQSFFFEYGHLKAWLPLILGLVGAFVGIVTIIGIYFVYRFYCGKKDGYMNRVVNTKKA